MKSRKNQFIPRLRKRSGIAATKRFNRDGQDMQDKQILSQHEEHEGNEEKKISQPVTATIAVQADYWFTLCSL